MVKCFFQGQSGNNLFQYFLAWCVSKEKNYAVEFQYKTMQIGSVKSSDNYFNFNEIYLPNKIEGDRVDENYIKFTAHDFDWEKAMNHDGGIILEGFFQNYSYYEKFSDDIIKLTHDHNNFQFQDNKNITAHLRINNYPWIINDLNYYKNILENETYDEVHIISDILEHPIIDFLKNEYNAKLLKTNNDFFYLMNSNKVILSQSTFSWWATYLGNNERIFYPVFNDNYEKGIWYETPRRNIDLYIKDKHTKIII